MTMLWMDSLDLYGSNSDLANNYVSNNFGAINFYPTGGRFGGGALSGQANFSAGAYYAMRQLGSTNGELWVSFAAELSAGGTQGNSDLVALGVGSSNNSGVEIALQYNVLTGIWSFSKPNTGNVTTVNYPVAFGWHWIDWRVVYSGTVGQIELWVDDVQVYTGTGLNTVDNGGFSGWTVMHLFGNGAWLLDDPFVYTPGTRIGDSRIETIVPASDVGPNNGTPSSGSSHYAMVDEAHIDTTNYITMPNTSGDKEVFSVGSITGTPINVWAVKVELISQKSDAGSFQLEPLVISSGTEGDGSAQQLLTSYAAQNAIFETNPHTSAQWVYTDVNAMNVGFKVP